MSLSCRYCSNSAPEYDMFRQEKIVGGSETVCKYHIDHSLNYHKLRR